MAFNFLGTLNIDQLQEFRSFLEEQYVDIDQEINNLYVEKNSFQKTLDEFCESDAFFGGNAKKVLFSNELVDVKRSGKQDDSVSADLMSRIKKPFISTIKYKRERNEYKMKKLLDNIEQTNQLIDLKSIAKSETIALLNELESKFSDKSSTVLFSNESKMNDFSRGLTKPDELKPVSKSLNNSATPQQSYLIFDSITTISGTTSESIRVTNAQTGAVEEGRNFKNDSTSAKSYLNTLLQKYPGAKIQKENN